MSAGFINNTKHFAVTNTSTLIQDALDDGRLENPYVDLVDGELDYNSMEPEEPPQELYLDATYISERRDVGVVGQDPESFCSAVYLDGDYTTNIIGDIYTHGDGYRYDFGDDGDKFSFEEDTDNFTITWQDDIPGDKGEILTGFVVRTTPHHTEDDL